MKINFKKQKTKKWGRGIWEKINNCSLILKKYAYFSLISLQHAKLPKIMGFWKKGKQNWPAARTPFLNIFLFGPKIITQERAVGLKSLEFTENFGDLFLDVGVFNFFRVSLNFMKLQKTSRPFFFLIGVFDFLGVSLKCMKCRYFGEPPLCY